MHAMRRVAVSLHNADYRNNLTTCILRPQKLHFADSDSWSSLDAAAPVCTPDSEGEQDRQDNQDKYENEGDRCWGFEGIDAEEWFVVRFIPSYFHCIRRLCLVRWAGRVE